MLRTENPGSLYACDRRLHFSRKLVTSWTRVEKTSFSQRMLLVAANLYSASSIQSEPSTSITLAGFLWFANDGKGTTGEQM